jgi:hypothetical protein
MGKVGRTFVFKITVQFLVLSGAKTIRFPVARKAMTVTL